MIVLGPGAVCCGDPIGCEIECDQKQLLFEPEGVEPDVELADWEKELLGIDDDKEEDDE